MTRTVFCKRYQQELEGLAKFAGATLQRRGVLGSTSRGRTGIWSRTRLDRGRCPDGTS